MNILHHVGRFEDEGRVPIGLELIAECVSPDTFLRKRVESLVAREYLVYLLRAQGPSYETTLNGRSVSKPWIAAEDQEWVETKAAIPDDVTATLGVWTPRGVCHAVAGDAAFTVCGKPVVDLQDFRRLPWLGGAVDARCPACVGVYE
jgi:hypothetical protein